MKRHALFVGVNDYADPTIQNLAFPTEDATELASVFRRLLKFDRVEKLINPAHAPEVVDAVEDMTQGLGEGDVFMFFFAGHGFRVKENHVLVCAKDKYTMLEDEYAGLPVGLLKKVMRGSWNRMLVLDACQNDIRATRGADCGVASRDLGLIHALDDGAPGSGFQIVVTSCSEGQKALEVADLRHGLFTSAFLDSVTSFVDARRRIDLEVLRTDLGGRMSQLISKYRLSGRQEPMFTMPADAGGIVLLDGVAPTPSVPASSVPASSDPQPSARQSPHTDKKAEEDEIGWQRMLHELVSGVNIFPHVKLGDGFAQYAVADDISAVLISFWPSSRYNAKKVVSDLEKAKADLERKEPEILLEMVIVFENAIPPDNAAELRSRGMRVMNKTQFVAFMVDYFSEKNIPLRTGKALFRLGRYVDSFKSLESFVNQGTTDPEAQYMIGYMYDHGKGVIRDEKEAEIWYSKAAHQHYAKAIDVMLEKIEARKKELSAEIERRGWTDAVESLIKGFGVTISQHQDDKGGGEAEVAERTDKSFQEEGDETLRNVMSLQPGTCHVMTLPGGAKMEFVWCPPGVFSMGSPIGEEGRESTETQHRVKLTKGFWLGKYPVTQGQWKSVMGDNPSRSRLKGDGLPVDSVSWDDCQKFIRKVNEGRFCGARLPTEAEWEYACRAGATGAYGGTGKLDEMGWFYDNSDHSTHPVGQKKPNAWGIYDMHGNVSELCSDWYDEYSSGTTIDPTGPVSGDQHVLRGGNFFFGAWRCRSACRFSVYPSLGFHFQGFRLAYTSELWVYEEVKRKARKDAERKAREEIKETRRKMVETAEKLIEKIRREGPAAGTEKIIKMPGGVKMRFRWCPAGTFIMGSPDSEQGRSSDEIQHRVALTKGFWLGETQVTQKQWKSVMGNNPSKFRSSGFKAWFVDDNRPVEKVSWDDCQEFIKKVNAALGCGARLPTEAEWEYACRAGTTGAYGGTGNLDEMGWFDDNSGLTTHPVGQKKPNAWGLCDMHGNVCEWCADWYGAYTVGNAVDPTGLASGRDRVLRGGGWDANAQFCRSAQRFMDSPVNCGWGTYSYGFRLCCSAEFRVDVEREEIERMTCENAKLQEEEEAALRSQNKEVDAWYEKGEDFFYGRNGVVRDYTEAVKWYRKAAEQGDVNAQCELGRMYDHGWGVEQNYAEAVKWYRKAAEQGHAIAQRNLGMMYANGEGVTKDAVEAVKWYRKAAGQGYVNAQFLLGMMYYNGEGVVKDAVEAREWFRVAAEQGHADAQFSLGVMYYKGEGVAKDAAEAAKWFRAAAEQGNADAQLNLGGMYARGEGVAKDAAEAAKWFRAAAEQGDVNAQFNLGVMYDDGEGVAKDAAEAAKWFRAAAEQGKAGAQLNLGGMYARGEGVAEDYVEAVKWYRAAAEQGNAGAQFNLGGMYARGEGVVKDAAEAVEWYRAAAEQRLAVAQFYLGNCYHQGDGVAQSDEEAAKWYQRAAEQGFEEARKALERMK